MPENTLRAFAEHGRGLSARSTATRPRLSGPWPRPPRRAWISIRSCVRLEREGIKAFDDSYTELSETMESEFAAVVGA